MQRVRNHMVEAYGFRGCSTEDADDVQWNVALSAHLTDTDEFVFLQNIFQVLYHPFIERTPVDVHY